MSETLESYRPRSLGNLHAIARDDSNVSMLSERFNTSLRPDYDTQSLDRRRLGYRHVGMGGGGGGFLADNMGYVSDGGAFNSFGGSLGSKQSLGQISAISDSPEKYRDIAL